MNVPTHFYLKRRKWTIELADESILGDVKCRGWCDEEERIIYIRSGMTDRMTVRTLIHEMCHACEHEFGFKIRHKDIYTIEIPLARLYMLIALCQPVRALPRRRLPRAA